MSELRKPDEFYMRRALELAEKGRGWVSPNPVVGAVIVRDDGTVIAEGYHERYGDLHAERNALRHCAEPPAGATMYVTLEPCCHHGRQPPVPTRFWRQGSGGWSLAAATPIRRFAAGELRF